MSRPRYQTPLPRLWFFQRPAFRRYLVRESTAIFLSIYLVYLLVWLARLGQGPEAFDAFVAASRRPLMIALHVVALLAAIYHSVTWFNLTPKIMPVYIGEDKLPDLPAAIAMGYGPWLTVSALLVWGVLQMGGGAT